MNDYFAELGREIDRRWRAAHRDEEALATIAAETLTAMPPRDAFDPFALARAFLEPGRASTRQLAPTGAFGQPAITVHHGQGFVVDVYFWINCLSALHNHPFCGAFTLLSGHSLHSVWRFTERARFGPRASLGELTHEGVELLDAGAVVPFSRVERPLIHTLMHVPRPSVSMVVRTVKALEYFRYLPPGVRLAMSEDDDVARQLRLLEMLRASGRDDYPDALCEYVSSADAETALRALFATQVGVPRDALRDRVDATVRARFGDDSQVIFAALDEAARVAEIDAVRAEMSSDEDRFVASLMLCATTRAQALSLTAQRFGDDPVARLASWPERAGLFAPDDRAPIEAARAMARTGSLTATMAHLRETFADEFDDTMADALARWCRRSIYAPLVAGA
jgi:hypothetical protein